MNHATLFSRQLQQISHNLEQHAPLPALALIHEMNSANPRVNPKQKIALLLLKAQAETELGQSHALSNTLNEALGLSQGADLALERLQIMNQLADQMYTMGNYRQSIQLWLSCIELGLELGDTTTAISAFISIGGIFNAADEHERAYKLHLQALQYCRNIATPYIYCTIRLYLAADAMWLKRPADTLRLLDEADPIIQQHQFHHELAESYLWRAQALLQLNQNDEAIRYLNQALAYAEKTHHFWAQIKCGHQLGLVYTQQQRYADAEQSLLEAQAIAKDSEFMQLLRDCLLALSTLYEQMGQAKQALLALQAAHDLEHGLAKRAPILELEPRILKQLALLETRFSLEISRQENRQLIEVQAQQSQKLDQLRTEVEQDPLTKLANRRWLDTHLPQQLRSISEQEPLSILLLDLDHFKKINDDFSHLIGDEVLRELGFILQRACRDVDTPVRYGGEEFLLSLRGLNLFSAAKVAERIRHQVEKHRWPASLGHRAVTISIGVAQAHQGDSLSSLIERADQALYCAKSLGRNRVEL
ncbi:MULTISPECIES: GGDEF domain-containing protein [Deefgea]|uniref:diguanylate cyclase n=2 Tax=Deefgea TaxID=400947 RepID=A0A6M8SMG0_9NEIS|nr:MULTISPECIES: GGDEF domain-containing protein [Deefgea]MCB5196243.1 diguanylate cyclase [Deefgea salmonis]QKJ65324.1 diguanylate cyclase [Deefgea piscis]